MNIISEEQLNGDVAWIRVFEGCCACCAAGEEPRQLGSHRPAGGAAAADGAATAPCGRAGSLILLSPGVHSRLAF
jgi:hypothetical protein